MAENCAESAITDTPQMSATAIATFGHGKSAATSRQHAPLAAMAIMVTRERERTSCDFSARSAAIPAQMHPKSPTDMTAKEVAWIGAVLAPVPSAAASITATHVHSE